MATYADYAQQIQQSTMPTVQSDFALYSYQGTAWDQEQNYMTSTSYQSHDSITPTALEQYQASAAYATSGQDQFTFQSNYFQQPKSSLHAPSPHYSPTNSTTHSFDFHNLPVLSSTSDSGASVQSTSSSVRGSPSIHPRQPQSWTQQQHPIGRPNILHHDSMVQDLFASSGFDLETIPATDKGCVDPSLIQPYPAVQYPVSTFPLQPPHNFLQPSAPSPNPTKMSANGSARSASPYMRTHSWQPYPASIPSRRQSVSSVHSRHSVASGSSSDDSNKGLCPLPTCGRHVKDLKAHMLTHQNERPEKCPIPICEYHVKGFARKYDKNRHTLTHYKGTMVCGFCPGSGSAAEKSFNRADVFKRHLTSVHGVEQTPPNARRKTPGSGPGSSKRGASAGETPGICSTCSLTFASPQDFYEHLDDCVLRIVQQAEPSEAINEMLLASVTEDQDVQDTMERHNLPSGLDFSASTSLGGDEDEAVEDEEGDDEDNNDGTYGDRTGKSGKGSIRSRKSGSSSGSSYPRGALGDHISSNGGIGKLPASRKSGGLTYSKNGVPLATAGKAPKRRKNYPLSWGAAPDKMKMRKRVLCVFDGPRRLWKDDMMLDADHEVRVPLPQEMGDGRQWVTDLDVETLRRAEGVLGATEEEKGPWVVDDDEDDGELERLMQ